jgi:hypothetical protein
LRTLVAYGAASPLQALGPLFTLSTIGAVLACRSCGTLWTLRPLGAKRTGRALLPVLPSRALRSLIALCSGGAASSLRT